MKTMLILAITLLSVSAHSKTLTRPFKIKLVSTDTKIDFKKYTPEIKVSCNYRHLMGTGDIWAPQIPEMGNASCGSYEEKVILNSNNELEIPAIRSTDNNQGVKIKNLKVEISLTDKAKPSSWKRLLVITASGKDVINQLVENKEPINFYTVQVNNLKISYEGLDFLGSAPTQDVRADLKVNIVRYESLDNVADNSRNKIFINSLINDVSFEASDRPDSRFKPIKDIRTVDFGELTFATLGNRVDIASVYISFFSEKNMGFPSSYKTKVPMTVEALENLETIVLK